MKTIFKTILKIWVAILFIVVLICVTWAAAIGVATIADKVQDNMERNAVCKRVGTGFANYDGEASCMATTLWFCEKGKAVELTPRGE